METDDLVISIIDRQKRNKTLKLRKIILLLSISFLFLIIYFPDTKIFSVDPFYIKSFMFLIAGILIPIGITFAFKVPGKGKITFRNSSLQIQIGKRIVEIPVTDEYEIVFYILKGNDADASTTYYIEIKNKVKSLLFELDIVFVKEKVGLEKVKANWRNQNLTFKELFTPPNSRS